MLRSPLLRHNDNSEARAPHFPQHSNYLFCYIYVYYVTFIMVTIKLKVICIIIYEITKGMSSVRHLQNMVKYPPCTVVKTELRIVSV